MMTTSPPTAADIIADLSRRDQAFLLGWIGSELDAGQVFTMGSLRRAVDAARQTNENVQRLVTP